MNKPQLTANQLLRAGFQRIGCWELSSEQRLTHGIEFAPLRGVYAFAIDGVVQYVGVASKSLRQRLGMYVNPANSQRTNIRLNEIICGQIEQGAVVEILTAHPPDQEWKGLKISGPEGLEAGIISEFCLPWNVKGATKAAEFIPNEYKLADPINRISEIVRRRPGLTELEIARAMYGSNAVQQQVNPDCRLLVELGSVERRGEGGRIDPYRYFPANNPPAAIMRMRLRSLLPDEPPTSASTGDESASHEEE